MSSGTKEVVQLKIARTNYKHEVPSKRDRSAKPKRDSSRGRSASRTQSAISERERQEGMYFSGNGDDAKGVPSANFPMMVHQVSRDKLRLQDQRPVARRARSRPEALVGRNRTALVDPRVLKDPDHPKETKVQVPARQLLLQFA